MARRLVPTSFSRYAGDCGRQEAAGTPSSRSENARSSIDLIAASVDN